MDLKSIKFSPQKIDDFTLAVGFDQLCYLCGSNQVEMVPEVEYLDKRRISSFCLSLYCGSPGCRNISYNYMELDQNMEASANLEDFTPLPKGLKLTCLQCGGQNVGVRVKLNQSGFKHGYDIVSITLHCQCGNQAQHNFVGSYLKHNQSLTSFMPE